MIEKEKEEKPIKEITVRKNIFKAKTNISAWTNLDLSDFLQKLK